MRLNGYKEVFKLIVKVEDRAIMEIAMHYDFAFKDLNVATFYLNEEL